MSKHNWYFRAAKPRRFVVGRVDGGYLTPEQTGFHQRVKQIHFDTLDEVGIFIEHLPDGGTVNEILTRYYLDGPDPKENDAR